MNKLTHFSLFTGIGGIDLAGEWAGYETVGQCEWADYQTKVLEKHWPEIPRWRDIRSVTAESFFERTGRTTVDLVSGGFPCQPFSQAGLRKGSDDDRYLWPEMLRVIRELKPTWVIGENVAGIVTMALDTVITDLEAQGYEVQAFIIPAAGVDAPHHRKRVFIVAYSNNRHWSRKAVGILAKQGWEKTNRLTGNGEALAYSDGKGSQGCCETGNTGSEGQDFYKQPSGCSNGSKWWAVEPRVGRVAHGVPNRSHRLKCLGNAVVPQQVFPILKAIASIEQGNN